MTHGQVNIFFTELHSDEHELSNNPTTRKSPLPKESICDTMSKAGHPFVAFQYIFFIGPILF